MSESAPSQEIVGKRLSAVVFVMDYVQLQFDPPPTVTALTPITITSATGPAVTSGDDSFRNRLCGRIGKTVANVTIAGEAFRIVFEDLIAIEISMRAEDCPGAESIIVNGRENTQVFRPGEKS
jgi:hypothetical protein